MDPKLQRERIAILYGRYFAAVVSQFKEGRTTEADTVRLLLGHIRALQPSHPLAFVGVDLNDIDNVTATGTQNGNVLVCRAQKAIATMCRNDPGVLPKLQELYELVRF